MEMKTMVIAEDALKKEVPALVKQAEDFKVATDQSAEEAAGVLAKMKEKLDVSKEFFSPLVETAHAAHKAVCDRRSEIQGPLEAAIKILRQKVADYQLKKQQEADERDRKAAAAAKEKEDKARQKLLDDAAAAQRAGNSEKAEELTEKAAAVYVPPKTSAPAFKATGISVKAIWVPEITDEKKVPVKWRGEVDLPRIQRARAADEKLEIPGIRFVQKAQGAVRGSR